MLPTVRPLPIKERRSANVSSHPSLPAAVVAAFVLVPQVYIARRGIGDVDPVFRLRVAVGVAVVLALSVGATAPSSVGPVAVAGVIVLWWGAVEFRGGYRDAVETR